MVAIWFGQPFWSLPLPLPWPLWPPLSLPLFLPFFPPLGAASLPFWGVTVKKGVSWVRVEASPLELLDGPLPVPIVVWGDGLPFTGPCSKPAYTVRGGGVEEDGAPLEEDGSVSDGPGCIPIGRGRSGGVRPGIRHAWWRWRRSAQRGNSKRGTGDRTGSVRVSQTGKSLLGALHLTTFRGSSIQFLVIFCFPGIKEGSELMDREFATEVARKDGRDGNLAVAWEVEVLAVIDTRGAREKPLSDGLWDVQPKNLSPDLAILSNVIRQREEVRVREKCCGFVLVVEGIGITYRSF